ncbi:MULTISPECIES: SUMF1/EgtB/PvdO family nonheme iron enzyme [Aeromonas]|uniref:SUMF1/EgtB/PvdO family nonheme iron enzyme n=1 Tax=Aeromonas TaxID=642 RepID=UPI0022E53865|nr:MULTISPECIES: SUMF1/EgtB/PvdO family nonheme iron enzyme [Aeromonas]WEA32225.1 SUMF1/EgtB/PvdO family nonheme iron enzyme [Aeromonas hydrophila]
MAGIWYRAGTVAVTSGSTKVVGAGTTWKSGVYKPDKGHIFWGPDGRAYEVDYVESDTALYLVTAYAGGSATGQAYSIVISITGQVPAFSRELSAFVAYHQGQMDGWQKLLTGTGDITLTAPDGTKLTIPSWDKVMNAGYGVVEQATAQADRATSAADSINAEAPTGAGKLMRVGGPAILDSERYSLERATGGRQTIIRDRLGRPSVMFILPRFRYEDVGMSDVMGAGNVTAFDLGAGGIKSEIFIGAYLASDGGISAPKAVPLAGLSHTAAKAVCADMGAGWHMMTAHEWAAISLWCAANGGEILGNTYWGQSHTLSHIFGSRVDKAPPAEVSGNGATLTGSLGVRSSHDRSDAGVFDLVGNLTEWQHGILIDDGRVKVSPANTFSEDDMVWTDAYMAFKGGSLVLSASAGEVSGSSRRAVWAQMGQDSSYASRNDLKRLLIEPTQKTQLPGNVDVVLSGQRVLQRGGMWQQMAGAGLASINLNDPRDAGWVGVGFRPCFA